jgi:hypothetical protein
VRSESVRVVINNVEKRVMVEYVRVGEGGERK